MKVFFVFEKRPLALLMYFRVCVFRASPGHKKLGPGWHLMRPGVSAWVAMGQFGRGGGGGEQRRAIVSCTEEVHTIVFKQLRAMREG